MKNSYPLRRSHYLRKVKMVRDRKLKDKEGGSPCKAGNIIISLELSESL